VFDRVAPMGRSDLTSLATSADGSLIASGSAGADGLWMWPAAPARRSWPPAKPSGLRVCRLALTCLWPCFAALVLRMPGQGRSSASRAWTQRTWRSDREL
jgi:hypothetical protein